MSSPPIQSPAWSPAWSPARSPVQSTSGRKSARILGLDIARALAMIGMVIVNFKTVMAAGVTSTLGQIASLIDGRAAATFVVLAGIGASLGARRARRSDSSAVRRTAQVTLLRRALFLFVIGWAFYPIWPADILHFYGVYLAVGAVVLFAPDRRLLLLAAASVAASFVFLLVGDYFVHWDLATLSYQTMRTPEGFLRNLLLDGFHPVVPWVAFYLWGMWLGRLDLRDRALRKHLAVRALAVVVVVELVSWLAVGPRGLDPVALGDDSWRVLLAVEPIPPMPLYMLTGTATATLVILGSIELGERLSTRATEPLVATGQLALTLYFAHVLVGMGILEQIGRLEHQTMGVALTASLVFCAGAVAASWAWRRRFDRGPAEWLMRRIAG